MNTDITSDDKLWAALGYPIFPIAIIMLLVEGKKDRPFIKFHAVQALALNVAVWVVEIILGILSAALAAVTLRDWRTYQLHRADYLATLVLAGSPGLSRKILRGAGRYQLPPRPALDCIKLPTHSISPPVGGLLNFNRLQPFGGKIVI